MQSSKEMLGQQTNFFHWSLTPRKPGERKKTDRRDAKKLLGLFMADMLTEV